MPFRNPTLRVYLTFFFLNVPQTVLRHLSTKKPIKLKLLNRLKYQIAAQRLKFNVKFQNREAGNLLKII